MRMAELAEQIFATNFCNKFLRKISIMPREAKKFQNLEKYKFKNNGIDIHFLFL